jgi:hypothetical protein
VGLESNQSWQCCESRSVRQGTFASKENAFGFNHPLGPPVVLGHPRLANVWCHVQLQDRSKGRKRNGFSGKQQCLEQETVAFQSKDQGSELQKERTYL